MKRALIAAVLAMTLGAGLSWAKLPAPPAQTDEQKAAAEVAKAKKAEADKKRCRQPEQGAGPCGRKFQA